MKLIVRAVVAGLLVVGVGGCIPSGEADGKVAIPDPTKGVAVGGMCATAMDCRFGLACSPEKRVCEPKRSGLPGAMCFLSEECLPGHYCKQGMCAERNMPASPDGGQCSGEGDCSDGLTCVAQGLYGSCAKAGAGDIGSGCMTTGDCRGGLLCAQKKCSTFLMIEPWRGAMCPMAENATAKVLFHVPRSGDAPSEDFFRLPFPNDIRLKNGHVSMKGFPTPGVRLLPFDPIKRYTDAIEAQSTGFGTNQAVFFRFSREPDLGSFKKVGMPGVRIVNLSPGSTDYDRQLGHEWSGSTGRGSYICPWWLALRHPLGQPLRGGETYAAMLLTTATDKGGQPWQQDDDFKAMLAAAAPADPEMAAAWMAYAPLRAWIIDKKVNADEIAAAAVFTTEKVEDVLTKVRAAVRAAPVPEIKDFAKCEAGKMSVCEDGKMGKDHERGCFGAGDNFDEYQGTIAIPVFQKGKAPYDEPMDGGGIEIEGAAAKIQRTENVCFAVTVPKGTAPAAGWPVVVYGHGTGGNYRSHVDQGLAGEYAAGDVPGGKAEPMAMLGYDGVLHGARKGGSTRPSTELVYNFLNPDAARDNNLQAAADLFAIARALEAFNSGGVRLDKAKVGLWGHSQGANAGAVAVGFESGFGPSVLTGAGGTLLMSLLTKRNPVNIADAVQFVLMDTAKVGTDHPVLNLLQMWVERADPVNFGRRVFQEPPMGVKAHHFLQVYGTGDTYSPVETQRTVAKAIGLNVIGPVIDDFQIGNIEAPAKGNADAPMSVKVTAGQTQYKPPAGKDGKDKDGHFVSFDVPEARRSVRQFLGSGFRDGTPTIAP